jgi:chromosomal replication initiation ATPase DnaA
VTLDQLTLDLPHRAAHGAEDFLVSACNLAAVRLIDAWPDWQDSGQLLIGPAASGKTHLARVWQARSGARALTDASLDMTLIEGAGEGAALVVEDIDRGGYDEKALFHLLNLARERGLSLLLTSRDAPSRLGCALPDLLSRLNGLPVVQIGAPDEALLKTVMLKHFADRQLDIDPKVLDFLALRSDRSLAAAALVVEAVDRAALATGRKISRQLIAEALAVTAPPEEGAGG